MKSFLVHFLWTFGDFYWSHWSSSSSSSSTLSSSLKSEFCSSWKSLNVVAASKARFVLFVIRLLFSLVRFGADSSRCVAAIEMFLCTTCGRTRWSLWMSFPLCCLFIPWLAKSSVVVVVVVLVVLLTWKCTPSFVQKFCRFLDVVPHAVAKIDLYWNKESSASSRLTNQVSKTRLVFYRRIQT